MTTTHNSSNTTYLIIGGARSGKSGYAERIAKKSGNEVVYIATAKVYDNEIAERIKRHQNDRPKHWQTLEEPITLAKVLQKHSKPTTVILIDCLTMWVNNLLMQEDDALMENELQQFIEILPTLEGTVIFVSNEVGMGIVPMGQLSRRFVDESGRLHQQLGQAVDNVLLIVAGLAMEVKGTKPFN